MCILSNPSLQLEKYTGLFISDLLSGLLLTSTGTYFEPNVDVFY